MADAGPEQSGEDSDCDGPDRVVREWRSVQRDDGVVACSGYGESHGQGTQDDRQRIVRHDETLWLSIRGRRRSLLSGCRVFLMVLFSSIFLGQFARDMDVSVSFRTIKSTKRGLKKTKEISLPKWKKIHHGLLFTDHHVTHIIPGNWDVDRCVLNSVTSLKHKFSC